MTRSTQKDDVGIGKAWEYFARHPEQLAAHHHEKVLVLDPELGVLVGAATEAELQEKLARLTEPTPQEKFVIVHVADVHFSEWRTSLKQIAEHMLDLSDVLRGSTSSGVMPSAPASSTPPPPPPDPEQLAALRRICEGADAPRVAPFLGEHPALIPALLAAVEPLRAAFPSGSVLRLERSYFDAEELLFVRVHRHGLDVDEAEARMRAFNETWWPAQPPEVARHLELSVGWGD